MNNRVHLRQSEARFETHESPSAAPETLPPFSFSTTTYRYGETDCDFVDRRRRVTVHLKGVRYYGYRYYNPGLGRWVNRDPIREKGFELSIDDDLSLQRLVQSKGGEFLNIFSFVSNSPQNHVDPYGLQEGKQCCDEDSDGDGTPDKDDPDFDPCSKVNTGALGAVVCFHGKKYGCVWPKNWGADPIDPGVLACAQAHEDVHVNDPNIKCDDTRCDAYPPKRDPKDTLDQECPAYKAAYICLLTSGLSPSDPGWHYLKDIVDDWKEECEAAGKW